MSRLPRALLAALVAVLLAGCAVSFSTGDGDATGAGDGGGTGTGAPAGADGSPIQDVDQGDLSSDEQGAVEGTNAFWQRTFTESFRSSYRSPEVRGGYQGKNGPTCSGQPSVAFNAFYCPSEDFLAWDQNLMAAGYQRIGDAWVYLIIAHEWGHAIQARLQADQVSRAAELQADCFAGATLFGAADLGILTLEPGDTEELAQTLAAVADQYPWTQESDHGDARQRIASFQEGARGGPTACTA